MGTADGSIQGTTRVVNNGSAAQRYNIVVVSEGYQAAQMTQFANDTKAFVDVLFATRPFDELRTAINVYRVDVASTDSGADDPADCGGTGATARTYFDARFCGATGVRRLLVADSSSVIKVVSDQVPQWHSILVVVNTAVYGGSGGAVGTFSLATGANEIALHELGHTAFALADEYEYYQGCGVDTNRDSYTGGEPAEANVTIDSNRNTIKWASLIASTTSMPTTQNADCTQCDPQASPVATGTVGAFEGGRYFHCGVFRPEFDCKMRALGKPFCAVCRRRIRQVLSPFLHRVEVPRVIGEMRVDADRLVRAAGLQSRFIPAGGHNGLEVVKQAPPGGKVVAPRSLVTMTLERP